jgi:hypothetical protein
MKKILYLLILISILSSSALAQTNVFNTTSGTVYTDMAYLQATFVNQDPSPADPGAYVNLLFKIENRGTKSAENATLELIPEYPFSLDSGVSAITNLGTINGLQRGENAFLVKYKLKVDKDAINGDNEIKLKYYAGDGSVYNIATFNISVSNPRTDFDVVVQDSTTLAMANIGANTAQSVIVRIPEQQNFRVNGTSASIIGNLNAGDYTLVTFQLFPVRTSNISSGGNNLTVEISYTDTLGIRRTIQKNVSYGFGVGGINGNATGQFTQRGQSSLGISNSLLYIIIGAVGIVIVVVVVLVKIRTRKKK